MIIENENFPFQKNEVPNSYHMELEGLKRGIAALGEMELKIKNMVTDRHPQVTAWIRKELVEKEQLNHYFDVWHISKGKSGSRPE